MSAFSGNITRTLTDFVYKTYPPLREAFRQMGADVAREVWVNVPFPAEGDDAFLLRRAWVSIDRRAKECGIEFTGRVWSVEGRVLSREVVATRGQLEELAKDGYVESIVQNPGLTI